MIVVFVRESGWVPETRIARSARRDQVGGLPAFELVEPAASDEGSGGEPGCPGQVHEEDEVEAECGSVRAEPELADPGDHRTEHASPTDFRSPPESGHSSFSAALGGEPFDLGVDLGPEEEGDARQPEPDQHHDNG